MQQQEMASKGSAVRCRTDDAGRLIRFDALQRATQSSQPLGDETASSHYET